MITSLYIFTQYDFMRQAFVAGTVIAILAGIVGYFVVLKRLSFASHALSHIGFAGACGAGLIGLSFMTGQLILTVIAAMMMAFLGGRVQRNDTVIGIVLAFSLGLGSLFLYLYDHYAGSATRILFGNLLDVSNQSLWQIIGLSGVCVLVLAIIARPLWFCALLPELASARGLPVKALEYIFFILLAIAITLTSQAIGILLIFALLIGPSAIAIRLCQNFWSGMGLSVAINLFVVWAALILSAVTNWPLSFWITGLVLIVFLLMTFVKGTSRRAKV